MGGGDLKNRNIIILISKHAYLLTYKNLQESCKRMSFILVSTIPNGFTLATYLFN